MALTNYERVKRWREKNRALYNLQRRNRRKTKTAALVLAEPPKAESRTSKDRRQDEVGEARESADEAGIEPDHSRGGSQSSKSATLEALRALMKETISEPVADSKKPVVFRDDYGRVITERAWNILQERKRRAKEGGYQIDDYSQ